MFKLINFLLKKCDVLTFSMIATLCGLSLLASCASIPNMTLTKDVQREPINLNGANGGLSANRVGEILKKLKKNGEPTNIFDKHLALEAEIVGGPLVVGNQVTLLVDGPVTYAAMFEAISNAKDHINMETYIFESDEIGKRFAEVLMNKQRMGVQVNLIYDSIGSSNTSKEFFTTLKASGVNVLEYNPINPLDTRKSWQINQRDHRKLLIVDGQVAFVGGVNISSVYSSGSSKISKTNTANQPWRDTHIRIEGPVVREFQKLFISTWSLQKGDSLALKEYFPEQVNQGAEVVRAIGSSPDEAYSQIYETLLSAINSAETQVFVTNAYFVPDPKLLTALKEAVKRGADVRLILPAKTDSALVYYASRSYYDELLVANVKIYERQDALLHAKTAMIDGVWSTIGSANLDWRSFASNQEINAVILGQGFGAQMQNMFDQDLALSEQITLESWRSRSIAARIKERAARLWARFL